MKINKYNLHEVLDRSSIVLEMFNEYVEGHPIVENDKELNEKAKHITSLLGDFYQLVGQKRGR